MRLEERYDKVLAWFRERMPVANTELQYNDPFQLLVAVILSAQCTDKRVNMVTPALFEQFPDAESMSKASVEEIFELIKSISYPNNKSKHLSAMAKKLMEDFNGIVPDDFELLQTLPGVGRKTANVMEAVAFKRPAMPVDTHVPGSRSYRAGNGSQDTVGNGKTTRGAYSCRVAVHGSPLVDIARKICLRGKKAEV